MGAARYALALVALASVGFGVARVWPELGRQHDEYADWTPREVALAGATHERLNTNPIWAARRHARPGVRYWIDTGGPSALVYRTWAVYWLLPAVPAESRAEADVVLRWRDS